MINDLTRYVCSVYFLCLQQIACYIFAGDLFLINEMNDDMRTNARLSCDEAEKKHKQVIE